MGLFFPSEPNYFPEERPAGFQRYTQILERDWKRFWMVGFLTLLSFVPFVLGVGYAILSSSVLVLIPACILSGIIAGPGIAGMYDVILRALRDDVDDWWYSYKKAMKQNVRAAMLPGVVQCLFVGFFAFNCYMLWLGGASLGTAAILGASAFLVLMVYSVWWPQVVLFDQRAAIQLKNCLLFVLRYFWKTAKVAALQLLWWVIGVLFFPWTALLVPVLGVWYLWFVSTFLIYDELDEAFEIEDQLREAFGH